MAEYDSSFLQAVREDLRDIKEDVREVKGDVSDMKERVHDGALSNQKALNEISRQAETARLLAIECHAKFLEHEKECLREKTRARRNVWGAKEWLAALTGLVLAASTLVAAWRGMKAAESPGDAAREEVRHDLKKEDGK